MNGGKFLLDSNIISAWLKGEESVADKVDQSSAIYLSVVVLGELYYGANFSSQVQKNIKVIKKLVDQYRLLLLNVETAIEYGKIKSALRKKGRPIPENDIWIAAVAVRHKLTLVTCDKHFQEISGLKVSKW